MKGKTNLLPFSNDDLLNKCPFKNEAVCTGECELLTSRMVADFFMVSLSFVNNSRWQGTFVPYIKAQGNIRYLKCVVLDYLSQNTINPYKERNEN